MVIYNIQTNGPSTQLVIEIINDTVYVEPSSIAYILGNLELKTKVNGWKNKGKAYLIGKKYFKPCYSGTGKIYLKATLGSYHKFAMKNDEQLYIGQNAFIACRDTIQVIPCVKLSYNKFVTGMPLVTTMVKGSGNVVVHMPGPVAQIELTDDKFTAFNNDIAAYSTSLRLTKESISKVIANFGPKLVQVFRGSGVIYFTPNPNKDSKRGKF